MMEEKNPLGSLMDVSMQNLRKLIDSSAIIGQPITAPDGSVVIPVSRVSFGFATGGSEFPTQKPVTPFGGGGGGGVTIEPLGFLVMGADGVHLLQVATADNTADRIVNMVPAAIDGLSGIVDKIRKNKPAGEKTAGGQE